MSEGGAALMAVGKGEGEEKARQAANMALSSRMLDVTIDGAQGILFNVTGGPNLSLYEVNEAAAIIRETAHPDANMIFGAVIDETMGDEMRITVIATGFERDTSRRQVLQRQYSRPTRTQQTADVPAGSPAPAPRSSKDEPVRPKFSPQDLDIPAFLRRR